VLAYMGFPARRHRTKLHSANPLERLNGEIKRRTEVVGIFPNEAAIADLSAPSRSNKMTSGPSNALATSRWKASLSCQR
jgi:transposase-like protein